jgi:hypothetical protein
MEERKEQINFFFMGKPQPLHQSDAYGFYFIKSCPKTSVIKSYKSRVVQGGYVDELAKN